MFRAKTFALSLALCAFTLTPALASAQGWLNQVGSGGLNEIGSSAYGETGAPTKGIIAIVASLIKVVLGLLGVIFVVLLIINGFKYMTSGGSQDKIEEAVHGIRSAVIGIIIIVCALAITTFITSYVIPQING